jgi:hypothetical protein
MAKAGLKHKPLSMGSIIRLAMVVVFFFDAEHSRAQLENNHFHQSHPPPNAL